MHFGLEVKWLNFQPLEVVDRGSETQPEVVNNYPYLFDLRPNIYKTLCLNSNFIPNNSGLIC